jgi:hypothetical protein
MLGGIFGPKMAEDVKSLKAEAEWWAESLGYEAELLKSGHLRFKGESAGYRWRLTAGPSSRPYFKQSEIKLGLSAVINPNVQGVIATRRLAELMKQMVYGQATADSNTYALDELPFEMTAAATQRERVLPDQILQQICCHSDATPALADYAVEIMKSLPGGYESVELNTLLPWVIAVQPAGVVLRIGVPAVKLELVKSALRMQISVIKPLHIIAAREAERPPDSGALE